MTGIAELIGDDVEEKGELIRYLEIGINEIESAQSTVFERGANDQVLFVLDDGVETHRMINPDTDFYYTFLPHVSRDLDSETEGAAILGDDDYYLNLFGLLGGMQPIICAEDIAKSNAEKETVRNLSKKIFSAFFEKNFQRAVEAEIRERQSLDPGAVDRANVEAYVFETHATKVVLALTIQVGGYLIDGFIEKTEEDLGRARLYRSGRRERPDDLGPDWYSASIEKRLSLCQTGLTATWMHGDNWDEDTGDLSYACEVVREKAAELGYPLPKQALLVDPALREINFNFAPSDV